MKASTPRYLVEVEMAEPYDIWTEGRDRYDLRAVSRVDAILAAEQLFRRAHDLDPGVELCSEVVGVR